MKNKKYNYLGQIISSIAMHQDIDPTYYKLEIVENTFNIFLKKMYSSLSLKDSLDFQMAISNLLSRHGVRFQQIIFYDESDAIKEIVITLTLEELNKIETELGKIFQ